MYITKKAEKTLAAWAWRVLLGPALLLEGLLQTVTLGTIYTGAVVRVASRLARARINAN